MHDEGDFTPNTSYQLAMDEFMANEKHITLIGWIVLPYDKPDDEVGLFVAVSS